MIHYKNINGNSAIETYEILADGIKIKFDSGCIYTFTNFSAGNRNIENMKILASRGDGLNNYINKNVKHRYSHKTC